MTEQGATKRVPVTVLTGALGAGKTTLLNELLTQTRDRKMAVIVNEFGDAGIDGALIDTGAEELIELSSGCVCCVVRGDLIRTLRNLLRTRDDLDGIVIETTGLANPAPVLQTFMADQILAARCRLDAVITVVDAIHICSQLDQSSDAADQIAVADCIILNKVSDSLNLNLVREKITSINPFATLIETDRSIVTSAAVFDLHSFDAARLANQIVGSKHHVHDHIESAGISSVTLHESSPLRATVFQNWLQTLLIEQGADILRIKGIVDLENEDNRTVIQAVHMLIESEEIGSWLDSKRQSQLVFIGRNLNSIALQAGLTACTNKKVNH